ncbi:MAG TPA: beta-propeller fold lactonase family protein, partial [Chryseolinea sp.]|nr:beta-propeller fold lactonase family protein [Chryseolinea sp.]
MKICTTLLLMTSLFSVAMAQSKTASLNLLVGTYTQPGKSEGIYVYNFNPATGELTPKTEMKGIKNPTFLAVSKDKKFVYAVSETSEGTVNAYSFDPKTGQLMFLNSATSGGGGPCYVAVDDKRKFVYTGNYGGGSLTAIPLKSDGSLGSDV